MQISPTGALLQMVSANNHYLRCREEGSMCPELRIQVAEDGEDYRRGEGKWASR